MRKSRRVIGCILTLACAIIVLPGCGNMLGKTEESTFSITINTTEVVAETTARDTADRDTAETTKETEKESETTEPVDDKEILSISMSTFYDYKNDENTDNMQYDIEYQKLYINSYTAFQGSMIMKEDVPALSDALDKFNKNEEEIAANYLESFQELLQDDYVYPYKYTSEQYIQRADKHVLSILNKYSDYTGGVHGASGKIGFNYDTETGKELMLTDVITNTERLAEILHANLVTEHSDFLFGDPKDSIDSAISNNSLSWTIGYDRVTIYFQEYQVAAYAAGVITVELPFAQYQEIFDSKFFDIPESYAIQIPITEPSQEGFHYDLDEDGQYEVIIPSSDIGEYGDISSLWVEVDGQKTSIDCEAYSVKPTFIHMSNGNNYLYMEASLVDDYSNIFIFELSKSPRYIDYTGGLSAMSYALDDKQYLDTVITDPTNMELETRTDIVGTHDISKTYYIKDDGIPVSDESEYIFSGVPFQITSKIPILMTDEEGKKVTLPAGTVFDVLNTNDVDQVGLRSDSKTYILTFDQAKDPEYGYLSMEIDGKTVSDAFEGIYYPG